LTDIIDYVGFDNNSEEIRIIGIFISDEQEAEVPVNFFKHSISQLCQLQKQCLSIVLCSAVLLDYCAAAFSEIPYNYLEIVPASLRLEDEVEYFTLMSKCNHTIITNTHGALHAVINGGNATVFIPKAEETFFIPYLMSTIIAKWTPIFNDSTVMYI